MWGHLIAKLLGLYNLYKLALINYLKGLLSNLQDKIYIAYINRIKDTYLNKTILKSCAYHA